MGYYETAKTLTMRKGLLEHGRAPDGERPASLVRRRPNGVGEAQGGAELTLISQILHFLCPD